MKRNEDVCNSRGSQSDEQKEKGRLVCTLTDERGGASDASDAKQVRRPTRCKEIPHEVTASASTIREPAGKLAAS